MAAGRNAATASSVATVAAMASTPATATAPIIMAATATKAARARMATKRPPGVKLRRGSQATLELLHSSSARASRAATLATARRASA
jgi:hypothetical protein